MKQIEIITLHGRTYTISADFTADGVTATISAVGYNKKSVHIAHGDSATFQCAERFNEIIVTSKCAGVVHVCSRRRGAPMYAVTVTADGEQEIALNRIALDVSRPDWRKPYAKTT